MNWLIVLLDITAVTLLLVLAYQTLFAERIFTCVVFFIATGLLMAICWARLQAPDIALAEAAIGAGLTGSLFLAAMGRQNQKPNE